MVLRAHTCCCWEQPSVRGRFRTTLAVAQLGMRTRWSQMTHVKGRVQSTRLSRTPIFGRHLKRVVVQSIRSFQNKINAFANSRIGADGFAFDAVFWPTGLRKTVSAVLTWLDVRSAWFARGRRRLHVCTKEHGFVSRLVVVAHGDKRLRSVGTGGFIVEACLAWHRRSTTANVVSGRTLLYNTPSLATYQ